MKEYFVSFNVGYPHGEQKIDNTTISLYGEIDSYDDIKDIESKISEKLFLGKVTISIIFFHPLKSV